MNRMKTKNHGQVAIIDYLIVPEEFSLDGLVGKLGLFAYSTYGRTIQADSFLSFSDGYVNLNVYEATDPARFAALLENGPTIPEGYREVHVCVSGTSDEAERISREAAGMLEDARTLDLTQGAKEREALFAYRWKSTFSERRFFEEHLNMAMRLTDVVDAEDIQLQMGPLTLMLGQYINAQCFPAPQQRCLYSIREINRKEGIFEGKKARVSLFHLAGPVLSGIYGATCVLPFESGCPENETNVCNQAESFSGFYLFPENLIFGGSRHAEAEAALSSPGSCITFHGNTMPSYQWQDVEQQVRTGLVGKPMGRDIAAGNMADIGLLDAETKEGIQIGPEHMDRIVSLTRLAYDSYAKDII